MFREIIEQVHTISCPKDVNDLSNLFAQIPAHLAEELVEPILGGNSVRIERIVSCGQTSPEGFWFDQEESEFVVLFAGAARMRFEGEEPFAMTPGDYINIPAHRRHRVEWTTPEEPTIWLAVRLTNMLP
jgi:cupin 2 domain-containing protein